jgi:hypothetical protein
MQAILSWGKDITAMISDNGLNPPIFVAGRKN